MEEILVIITAFLILTAACTIVYISTKSKDLNHSDEIRIGLIGTFIFLFVSWIVIYIANIHPFVKPEFKKSPPPSYYHDKGAINEKGL